MTRYEYKVYEDKFAIYFCVIEKKMVPVGYLYKCVCVERINLKLGYAEDGTFQSMCSELIENLEAWKEWKHAELEPDLMYSREIALNYEQVAMALDVSDWSYFDMSDRAKELIMPGCDECGIKGGDEDV